MKRSAKFLKSSAACLCYYTAHAVPVSHGIWMIRRIVDKTYNTKIMDLLMLNSFKRKRKMEVEIKSFGNSNIKVLFLFANFLFNSTSKVDLFICDIEMAPRCCDEGATYGFFSNISINEAFIWIWKNPCKRNSQRRCSVKTGVLK